MISVVQVGSLACYNVAHVVDAPSAMRMPFPVIDDQQRTRFTTHPGG
jgi:hypothetical protein